MIYFIITLLLLLYYLLEQVELQFELELELDEDQLLPQELAVQSAVKVMSFAGIKPEDVYVVGDSGNDITMFSKYYDLSYCMKRGHPSARKYAKHIITRVYKLEKLILRGENHE